MKILWCSIVLLSYFILSINAQCSSLPGAACEDCFTWCPSSSHFCNTTSPVRDLCKRTCGTCATNNAECLELNCAQQCILGDINTAPRCDCFSGFQLESDGRSCSDINECEIDPDRCANVEDRSICLNMVGSVTCSSCKAINPRKTWSYYERSECCSRNRGSQCGQSSTNTIGRIVGGRHASALAWPWMAYVRINGNTCGGTLISDRHIMTAAHCVVRVINTPHIISIILGTSDIEDNTHVHVQTFRVVRVTVHPSYSFPDNDIAILELTSAVIESKYVSPVCLPNGETPSDGQVCYATGYGAQREGGVVSPILQQVDLPIVPISVCAEVYDNRTNDVDPDLHICAGYVEGGKDACQGDSGGPLVCQRCANCDWYLAGVVSFGRGCARPGYYGVYTNVTRYESWINMVTSLPVAPPQGECMRGSWLDWASWSECSVTCGVGERQRVRACTNGEVGDPGCIGEATEVATCNAAGTCNGPSWSSWSQGDCSVTCGFGVRQNVRICLNGNIGDAGCPSGGEIATEECFIVDCPAWSNWGQWSDCSVSCGNGMRRADRTCNTFGIVGASCDGSNSRTENCVQACWNEWSTWGSCSVSCSGGTQESSRMCQFGTAGGLGCPDEAVRERICNTQSCPSWSSWEFVGACSVSCGGGMRRQRRECNNGNPGELGCTGPTERFVDCNTQSCPSQWSEWGSYGECSATCGAGTQTRTRGCEGGAVGTGDCVPVLDATETISCEVQACANSEWTAWTPDGECSVSCGSGGQIRETRQCTNGVPEARTCTGPSERFVSCNEIACPAEWDSWGEFGACSAPCGGGSQTRTRSCVGGAVGTANCFGDERESQPCNTQACVTDNGPCAGTINVNPNENQCCQFQAAGHCHSFYRIYMLANCALSCCRLEQNLPCSSSPTNLPLCPPSEHASCPLVTHSCNLPNIAAACPIACNRCRRF